MLYRCCGRRQVNPLLGQRTMPLPRFGRTNLNFNFNKSVSIFWTTNQESDGEMQDAGGLEGEEKGEGEKSQKGGQQEDSLPFLNRHWLFLEGTSFEDRITINFAST